MSFAFARIENSPFASETASVFCTELMTSTLDCIIIKDYSLIVCEKLN
jgi:hypothetical protein